MRTQRPRHHVGPITLWFLRILFRYSTSREAFVLRGVGGRMGPVLKPRR